jgi:hypothetical protein
MLSALVTERLEPSCASCATPLWSDQRYCLRCGERRGPLPAAVASLLGLAPAVAERGAPPPEPEHEPEGLGAWLGGLSMPDPRAAAVAVMAILAFGVVVGSVVSPPADSAPGPVLVAVSAPPPAPAPVAAAQPAATPAATPAAAPVAAPVQQTITQTIAATAPAATTTPTSTVPVAPQLPPVRHVFMIVLSDHGYDAAFGPGSQAPYLSTELTKQGELLTNYYAVTEGALANEVALISGQGPNPDTTADCPTYRDVTPGTMDQDPQQTGQVIGSGCVFPRQAVTLPDELVANGASWKSYVEDMGNGTAGQPTTCRHPAPGAADGDRVPRAGDAYVTWRDPLVYLHSVIDSPTCATSDVALGQLTTDLKSAATTPSLSYIVPSRCHDGAEDPCAPGQPAGLPAADAFLKTVVPQIMASPAYKADGLIAITFDEAPQTGPNADSSACCAEPAYPNLPAGTPATPTPSTADAAGPPADGTATTTTPTTSTTPTSTTPDSTTTTSTTPAAPLPPGADTATGGGGHVGLLLISQFVKPGSVAVSNYNHFSLLRSIEDLFALQPTGYAGYPGVLAFDSVIYNAPVKRRR